LTFFRVVFILLAGGIILKLVIEKSLHSIAECFFICSCSGRNGRSTKTVRNRRSGCGTH
jgi:hypothetical protein